MNIQSASIAQPLRTLLFTSVEPSVGKSVTVSNLAIVMAQFGKRVILVDADLRKPAIHEIFGIPNENGLKDLIENQNLSVSNCLKDTKVDNLKVITSGLEQLGSLEWLGSDRMGNIVEELSSLADIILFDSPPALMVSDPYLVGKLMDGVILVSRVGMTRVELLKRVVSDLRMAGINLVGIVVQHLKSSEMYGYRYYRSYSKEVKSQKESNNKFVNVLQNLAGLPVGHKKASK